MENTDEIQEATGTGFLARPLHSKKGGEWYYYLRHISRPQRRGRGAATQKAGRPGLPTPALPLGGKGICRLVVFRSQPAEIIRMPGSKD